MDFRASLTNMLLTLPVVVIVGIAAHETGRMHFMAGTMAGLWLGSAHNVLWGWLVRNQASQNAGDVARPGNNLKSKE